MLDPIGSFDEIKGNFIRYVETAFSTKFESINKERHNLLNTDKVFYRQPWIEPLPNYHSSGNKIDDLTTEAMSNKMNEVELNQFKSLVKCGLFPENIEMYSHQEKMLLKAVSGENCVVTSGTGSG